MKKISQENYLLTEDELYESQVFKRASSSLESRILSEEEVRSIADDPDNLTDPRAVEDLPEEDHREISAQDITNDPEEAERVKDEYEDENEEEEDSEDSEDSDSKEDEESESDETEDSDGEESEGDEDSEESSEDDDSSEDEGDEEVSQESLEDVKSILNRLTHGKSLSDLEKEEVFLKLNSYSKVTNLPSLENYNPAYVDYGDLVVRAYKTLEKLKEKLK